MFSLDLCAEKSFSSDIYYASLRGSLPQLMVNRGYEGIMALDGTSGVEVESISFPDWAEDFCIFKWVVAKDGNTSYLFSDDDEIGFLLELNLEPFSFRKIRYSEDFSDTELSWYLPAPLFITQVGTAWTIENDRLEMADLKTRQKYLTPQLKELIENFGIEKFSVQNGVYVRGRNNDTIGFANFESNEQVLATHDGSAVDITHFKDALFVGYSDKIIQIQENNQSVEIEAQNDEEIRHINIVKSNNLGYLNVLISRWPDSIIRIYQIHP